MPDRTPLERDLTVMLRDRAAADTRPPVAAAGVARRARRRRVLNALSASAAVVLLLVGGTALLRSVGTDEVLSPPAVPITPHHNGVLLVHGPDGLTALSADGSTSVPFLATSLLPSDSNGVWSLRWAPDGNRVAFLAGRLSLNSDNDTVALFVADADGSNLRRLSGCPEEYSCGVAMGSGLSWSPDGRSIALASGHLYVVDVADGVRRRLPAGEPVLAPAWSPDGSVIAVADQSEIRTVPADAEAGDTSRTTTLARDLRGVSSIDWSADGTRLVASAADGLHVVDATGRKTFKVVSQRRGEGPGAATWSPDGTRIAYFTTPRVQGGFTAQLRVVNPDTGHDQVLWAAPCCVSTWHPPAWSPDGSRLALSVEIIGHPDRTGLFLVPAAGSSDAGEDTVRVVLDGVAPGLPADPTWQPRP